MIDPLNWSLHERDYKPLLEAIQLNAQDSVSCFALADLLTENGREEDAFVYRWMGWYQKRPCKRTRDGIRIPYVWWSDHRIPNMLADRPDFEAHPGARLPACIFVSLWGGEGRYADHIYYPSWEVAVEDLAQAWRIIRALQGPPGDQR